MSSKEDPGETPERGLANGKVLREEKRLRFEAKQERLAKKQKTVEQWETWISEHPSYASLVTCEDVRKLKPLKSSNDEVDDSGNDNDTSPISDLLRSYVDLQDGGALRPGDEFLFIAEGTETIRLLIQQSVHPEDPSSLSMNAIQVKSIFVKPSVLFALPVFLLADVEQATVKRNDETETKTKGAPPFHVFVGDEGTLSSVAGFQISRGALACGVVPDRNEAWLMDYLVQQNKKTLDGGLRLLALDGISDTANLGSMIRCASAFGVQAIVLSRDCCDAWYRRSVRVSMGHVFQVPCIRVEDLAATMQKLSLEPFAVTSYAAVIDTNADLILESVERGTFHFYLRRPLCKGRTNERVSNSSIGKTNFLCFTNQSQVTSQGRGAASWETKGTGYRVLSPRLAATRCVLIWCVAWIR